MPTQKYLSLLDETTREHRVYRQGDDDPKVTIHRNQGAEAGAVAASRAFQIRAGGNILLPKFSLHEGDQPIWRLSVRSPLMNVHRLEGESCGLWTLRSPFFNTRVSGESSASASLAGWIANNRVAWLLSFSGIEPPDELLVAVAVLHRLSFFHR